MREPKIGLALSGGASFGAAHVGVLQSFSEHNIPISCIAGTSAGAIVGALHAFGISEERTIERVANMSWRSVARLSLSKYSFISNDALGDILHDMLGDPRIEDAHIPLAIMATDITSGELVVFREGPVVPALLASSCIPGIFSPVNFNGRMLVDGGLINNLPLSQLAPMGADIEIGVNVIPSLPDHPPANWFDIMNRSFYILSKGRYADATDNHIVIQPDLAHYSYSSLGQATPMIAEGRRAADKEISRILEAIDAFKQERGVALLENKPSLLERAQSFVKKIF